MVPSRRIESAVPSIFVLFAFDFSLRVTLTGVLSSQLTPTGFVVSASLLSLIKPCYYLLVLAACRILPRGFSVTRPPMF